MGNRFLATYPATNVMNNSLTSMYKGIVEAFLLKFAPIKFGTVVIDSKNMVPNIYNTDASGYKLGSRYEEKEPKKPVIRFEFNSRGNNMDDTQLGLHSLKRMSGAYGFNAELRGYTPFFKDLFDVTFLYSPVFIRVDLNIGIVVSSKDDQLALMNVIDTNIDQRYNIIFDSVPMCFALPNDMISAYRTALFKEEMLKLQKPDMNDDIRKEMLETFNEIMHNNLRQYSNGYIDKMEYSIPKETQKIYDLLVYRNICMKLEKFQPDEGEKEKEVMSRYGISTSGYLEFQSIMNFLIDFPSVVNRNFIEEEMFRFEYEGKTKIYVKKFAQRYTETREKDPFLNFHRSEYKCLHDEQDIILDAVEDNERIEFFNDFVPKDELAFKFAMVAENVPASEFIQKIHYTIHKQDELLEFGVDYTLEDGGSTIVINKPDKYKAYHIKLLIDWVYFAEKWDAIVRKLIKVSKEKEIPLSEFITLGFNPFENREKVPHTSGIVYSDFGSDTEVKNFNIKEIKPKNQKIYFKG